MARASKTRKLPVRISVVMSVMDGYGERHLPNQCVMALELKDKYGPNGTNAITNVNVNLHDTRFTARATGDRYIFPHCAKLIDWLVEFDNGGTPDDMPVTYDTRTASIIPQREQAKRNAATQEQISRTAAKFGMTRDEYRQALRPHTHSRTR